MNQFVSALEQCVKCQNWHGALFIALTLPDICGKIDAPRAPSPKRYSQWFDKYVGDKYKSKGGPDREWHTFLSGKNCYALRCALLHEGKGDITKQNARKHLDSFHFTEPGQGIFIHKNQKNNTLQLQVDVFSRDIINGVKKWREDISSDSGKTAKADNLLKIHPPPRSLSL